MNDKRDDTSNQFKLTDQCFRFYRDNLPLVWIFKVLRILHSSKKSSFKWFNFTSTSFFNLALTVRSQPFTRVSNSNKDLLASSRCFSVGKHLWSQMESKVLYKERMRSFWNSTKSCWSSLYFSEHSLLKTRNVFKNQKCFYIKTDNGTNWKAYILIWNTVLIFDF